MLRPYGKMRYEDISQGEDDDLGTEESGQELLPKDNKLRGQQKTLSARSRILVVTNAACLILLIAVTSKLWIRGQCGCSIIGKIPYCELQIFIPN